MELVHGYAVSAASVAAVHDVWSRRIPNWVTLSTLCAGLAINTWLRGADGAVSSIVGAALGIALLLPFHLLHVIGGGDVKLLGAVGAVLGPQALISVVVYGAIVGGVMSVAILLMRGGVLSVMREALIRRRRPALSGATAPYGLAIASGVYLSLILPGVLR
jgi:prepilin peptidase CpaA